MSGNVESFVESSIYVQDGGHITASTALIWRRSASRKVLVFKLVLETFHEKLMCYCDQGSVVYVIEFYDGLKDDIGDIFGDLFVEIIKSFIFIHNLV
jgi:hypothetical protein